MAITWQVKGNPGEAVKEWRGYAWDIGSGVMALAVKLASVPGGSWDTAIVAASHQEGLGGSELLHRRLAHLGLACLRDGLVQIEVVEKTE